MRRNLSGLLTLPVIAAAACCLPVSIAAQESASPVVVSSLFEYVTAPEEMTNLEERSNYIVDHFWDPLDVKARSVDQSALNHAFEVYATPFRWADRGNVLKSVDRLLGRISKNPALMIQFAAAAEESLYGPRAGMWADEVYLKFLKALLDSKRVPEIRKVRYRDRYSTIRSTAVGATAPEFPFIGRAGGECRFRPSAGKYTLIEFGDPTCDDCRMARLKLESSAMLTSLVRDGRLDVAYFVVSPSDDSWMELVGDYPVKWTVGGAPEVDDIYDLRLTPSFYLVGPDGKIMMKNIDVETALEAVRQLNI